MAQNDLKIKIDRNIFCHSKREGHRNKAGMPRPISEWKHAHAVAVKTRLLRHVRLVHAVKCVVKNVMRMEKFKVEPFNEPKHTARELNNMCSILYDFLMDTYCHEENIVNLAAFRRDVFEVRRMQENPLPVP